jgi:DNA-binding response OmpR family regulator
MTENRKILIVEDEVKVATFIKKGLQTQDFDSEIASDGNAAFIPAIQLDIKDHVIVLGYKLPNDPENSKQALIIEFMFSIPTKSKR